MVFHEITKEAIQESIKNCREIDSRLVMAQESRRILDRLYGYTLSPVIWKKIAYGLSAGRVQSPGLRLIVNREYERMKFNKTTYFDATGKFETQESEAFESRLFQVGDKKIVMSKDFDSVTGELKNKEALCLNEAKIKDVIEKLKKHKVGLVTSVEGRESSSKSSPPFTTSTLQQESNRKLGMSSKNTMRVAQKLYEQGIITYMRTDSMTLSKEAISGARDAVESCFGKEYLTSSPKQFKSKSKLAQEAHEAIRPAGREFRHPDSLNLEEKEKKLYGLIWKRTLATQMVDAKKFTLAAKMKVGDGLFVVSGTKLIFPGFLKVYASDKQGDEWLPNFKQGDELRVCDILPIRHETKPPARFTEASLVQRLEKEGIGRPSTYASIIGTIQDRGYVNKVGNQLIPSFTGIGVIQLLEKHFKDLVEFGFTSVMEESLDGIALGQIDSLEFLKSFYLGKKGLKDIAEKRESKISPTDSRTIFLPLIKHQIKIGRYGPYVVAKTDSGDIQASIPEDIAPSDLNDEMIEAILKSQKDGPTPIGVHPESGKDIFVLTGRYGPYVQEGSIIDDGPKPKRASIPKDIKPDSVTLEQAVKLLILPRELGIHPTKNKPVITNVGRFGPYVGCDGEFRSLKKEVADPYTVTLEQALELLAQEKIAGFRAQKIKEIGRHPKSDQLIALYSGKYGNFLKQGKENVRLPDDLKEDLEKAKKEINLEKAVSFIEKFSKNL